MCTNNNSSSPHPTFPKLLRDALRNAATKDRTMPPLLASFNSSRNLTPLPFPPSPRSPLVTMPDDIISPISPASPPTTLRFSLKTNPRRHSLSPLSYQRFDGGEVATPLSEEGQHPTQIQPEANDLSLGSGNGSGPHSTELVNQRGMQHGLVDASGPTKSPVYIHRVPGSPRPEDYKICHEEGSELPYSPLHHVPADGLLSPNTLQNHSATSTHLCSSIENIECDGSSAESSLVGVESAESSARDRLVSFGALFPPRHNAHLSEDTGLLRPSSFKRDNSFRFGSSATAALIYPRMHNSSSIIKSVQHSIPQSFRCIGRRSVSFTAQRRKPERMRQAHTSRTHDDEDERWDYDSIRRKR